MKKFKPEVSAGKAALLGAAVGAMVTGSGSPLIPMAVGGVAAGIGMAVANRNEAKRAHSALSKEQFKKQINYHKDL
jgi:CHASE2 domain-containing sensor protein